MYVYIYVHVYVYVQNHDKFDERSRGWGWEGLPNLVHLPYAEYYGVAYIYEIPLPAQEKTEKARMEHLHYMLIMISLTMLDSIHFSWFKQHTWTLE